MYGRRVFFYKDTPPIVETPRWGVSTAGASLPQGHLYRRGISTQPLCLYDIYQSRREDCAACPLKPRCLSKPDTPARCLSIRVDEHTPNMIDEMKSKIDTPQGKQIYARRLAIINLVLANICVQKRLNCFTLRSKFKVGVQWKLFALGHDIGKIHRYKLAH